MLTKRFVIAALIACAVLFIAGCSIDQIDDLPEIDPENGIWDKYFVYPLYLALDWFADLLFGSYGLAIIAVTIIIRFLILPLTIKQLKSSRAMQKLQPQMQKLREKYKDNQQKLQEETMKLFQKHNVNPLGGCLPLLVQMPVLIAFYRAIMRSEHIREAAFIGLQLGQAPNYFPAILLPVLTAVTTYMQQKVMGVQANPQMKMMMTIMPAMIFFFALSLPSALSLYWVVGNIFTTVQSYFLRDMYQVNKEGK